MGGMNWEKKGGSTPPPWEGPGAPRGCLARGIPAEATRTAPSPDLESAVHGPRLPNGGTCSGGRAGEAEDRPTRKEVPSYSSVGRLRAECPGERSIDP